MSTVYVIPAGDDPEQHMKAATKAGADRIVVGVPPDAPANFTAPGAYTPPTAADQRTALRAQAQSATTVGQLKSIVLALIDGAS